MGLILSILETIKLVYSFKDKIPIKLTKKGFI